jgi:hypothetical protein
MPAYCYNLLIDTAIVLIGTVTMHACTFITLVANYKLPAYCYNLLIDTAIVLVDNDIMLAGSYNLFGV